MGINVKEINKATKYKLTNAMINKQDVSVGRDSICLSTERSSDFLRALRSFTLASYRPFIRKTNKRA